MDWQPIETAPKDGTEIDVWLVEPDGHGVRYADVKFEDGEWLYWSEREMGWAWVLMGESILTHWRPAPKPPKL